MQTIKDEMVELVGCVLTQVLSRVSEDEGREAVIEAARAIISSAAGILAREAGTEEATRALLAAEIAVEGIERRE
jgi:hypothetical protein